MTVERDWLDVASSSERWIVYGLIHPEDRYIFYVGITRGASARWRLDQHRHDRSSAVYELIKELESPERGIGPVEFCEFAIVWSEAAARHLETALIIALPQIENRTLVSETKGFWKHHVNHCGSRHWV